MGAFAAAKNPSDLKGEAVPVNLFMKSAVMTHCGSIDDPADHRDAVHHLAERSTSITTRATG
jgi:hypothetical protein